MEISTIPVHVVENHQEVLPFWSDFSNADLLHIDEHSDMHDGVSTNNQNLNESNFICKSVHEGNVSLIYWLKPHSLNRRLQYLGSKGDSLKTVLTQLGKIIWAGTDLNQSHLNLGIGSVIEKESISLSQSKPFILDIDLDAFCCVNAREIVPYTSPRTGTTEYIYRKFNNYDSINGYKLRIDQTLRLLTGLKHPNLITIARSIGYTPQEKADDVQSYLLKGIEACFNL
jgi:hypothetical protein